MYNKIVNYLYIYTWCPFHCIYSFTVSPYVYRLCLDHPSPCIRWIYVTVSGCWIRSHRNFYASLVWCSQTLIMLYHFTFDFYCCFFFCQEHVLLYLFSCICDVIQNMIFFVQMFQIESNSHLEWCSIVRQYFP